MQGKYRVRVESKDLTDRELMCVLLYMDIPAPTGEEEWDVYDIQALLDHYPVEV